VIAAPSPAGILRGPRRVALALIAVIITATTTAAFTESYRSLEHWATGHYLHGFFALIWPATIDTFVAVGELFLFVALIDRWDRRSRVLPWAVALGGLAVSVAGNIGQVPGHDWASRATAAVAPVAAAVSLSIGLAALKRIAVEHGRSRSAVATALEATGGLQPVGAEATGTDGYAGYARPVSDAVGGYVQTDSDLRELPAADTPDTVVAPVATGATEPTGDRSSRPVPVAVEAGSLAALATAAGLAATPADRYAAAATALGDDSPTAVATALTTAGYPTTAEAVRSARRRNRSAADRSRATVVPIREAASDR
jgi:hypothetical protein